MSDDVFPVPEAIARAAHCDDAKYQAMYRRSIEDPDGFWAEQAKRLDWLRFPTRIKDVDFEANARIRWFEDGTLNVSANCIDRHLATRGDQTAILWEGDDPKVDRKITYRELHRQVGKLANVLKELGVKKGDRVTIYMPMIPETAYAMLACARIGAVHSVVFGGFSPDSLADRVNDCGSKLVITDRRRTARRPHRPAQGQHRQSAPQLWPRRQGADVPARRHERADDRRPRPRRRPADGPGVGRVPARADGCRGPAVHPLHLRLDRQAQGRAAHDRRLSGLRRPDP